MFEGDGWSLGSNTKEAIREDRPLTDEERHRIPLALGRMQEFAGHTLISPLVDSLNALTQVLEELPGLAPHEFERGEFRSRLNGRLSAALTQFTGLRATIETTARALSLPMGSSAPANFDTLYKQHHAFRLVWMLRNVEQHYRSAATAITVSVDEDPETGESRTRPMINVSALCARYIAESEPRFRPAWEQLRDLWTDQPQTVDIRWVLQDAYQDCNTVVAMYMTEAEPIILADVHYIARLVGEIEPIGSACAIRVEHDPQDQNLLHINMKHLDPLIFGEALATLDAARKILGRPPLGDTTKFDPALQDSVSTGSEVPT
jgi:hypothetical protein